MPVSEAGYGAILVQGDSLRLMEELLHRQIITMARRDGHHSQRADELYAAVRQAVEREADMARALVTSSHGHADVRDSVMAQHSAPMQRWLSTSEAAKRLGCTPRHVTRLAQAEALVGKRSGGRGSPWKIDAASADAYAARRTA